MTEEQTIEPYVDEEDVKQTYIITIKDVDNKDMEIVTLIDKDKQVYLAHTSLLVLMGYESGTYGSNLESMFTGDSALTRTCKFINLPQSFNIHIDKKKGKTIKITFIPIYSIREIVEYKKSKLQDTIAKNNTVSNKVRRKPKMQYILDSVLTQIYNVTKNIIEPQREAQQCNKFTGVQQNDINSNQYDNTNHNTKVLDDTRCYINTQELTKYSTMKGSYVYQYKDEYLISVKAITKIKDEDNRNREITEYCLTVLDKVYIDSEDQDNIFITAQHIGKVLAYCTLYTPQVHELLYSYSNIVGELIKYKQQYKSIEEPLEGQMTFADLEEFNAKANMKRFEDIITPEIKIPEVAITPVKTIERPTQGVYELFTTAFVEQELPIELNFASLEGDRNRHKKMVPYNIKDSSVNLETFLNPNDATIEDCTIDQFMLDTQMAFILGLMSENNKIYVRFFNTLFLSLLSAYMNHHDPLTNYEDTYLTLGKVQLRAYDPSQEKSIAIGNKAVRQLLPTKEQKKDLDTHILMFNVEGELFVQPLFALFFHKYAHKYIEVKQHTIKGVSKYTVTFKMSQLLKDIGLEHVINNKKYVDIKENYTIYPNGIDYNAFFPNNDFVPYYNRSIWKPITNVMASNGFNPKKDALSYESIDKKIQEDNNG